MLDARSTAWEVQYEDVHYRHEFRAARGGGRLTAHVFSAQGRTGWIVAEGCDLIAGAIVPGGNPTAWKTAREAADAAMAACHARRVAALQDDDVTDAEIDDLKADILRSWADRYGAETIEARMKALRPRWESNPDDEPACGPGDLTDEQITEAAAYAAWADTFGPQDDEPAPDFTAYTSDLDRAKRRATP